MSPQVVPEPADEGERDREELPARSIQEPQQLAIERAAKWPCSCSLLPCDRSVALPGRMLMGADYLCRSDPLYSHVKEIEESSRLGRSERLDSQPKFFRLQPAVCS